MNMRGIPRCILDFARMMATLETHVVGIGFAMRQFFARVAATNPNPTKFTQSEQ
jgi:hypothetical protein